MHMAIKLNKIIMFKQVWLLLSNVASATYEASKKLTFKKSDLEREKMSADI